MFTSRAFLLTSEHELGITFIPGTRFNQNESLRKRAMINENAQHSPEMAI